MVWHDNESDFGEHSNLKDCNDQKSLGMIEICLLSPCAAPGAFRWMASVAGFACETEQYWIGAHGEHGVNSPCRDDSSKLRNIISSLPGAVLLPRVWMWWLVCMKQNANISEVTYRKHLARPTVRG